MTENQQEDIEFIKSKRYSYSLYCPILRNKDNERERGVICKEQLSPVIVYEGYIQDIYFLLPEEIQHLKKYEYPTVEALIADGWYVD